jgi:hypothetical protein
MRGLDPGLITQRSAVVHVGSDIAASEFSPSARATRVMCCSETPARGKHEHRNRRRPVCTEDYDVAGVRHGLSEAKRERAADWSGSQQSPGTFEVPV